MEYVRLVHPRHFDRVKQRFNDLAFKRSSGDGGMSVFDRLCAEATSGVICEHIAQFYHGLAGDPAVFYILNDNELPPDFSVIETLSDTGDACHREIMDVGNSALKRA